MSEQQREDIAAGGTMSVDEFMNFASIGKTEAYKLLANNTVLSRRTAGAGSCTGGRRSSGWRRSWRRPAPESRSARQRLPRRRAKVGPRAMTSRRGPRSLSIGSSFCGYYC
jgi:hypothetical protein